MSSLEFESGFIYLFIFLFFFSFSIQDKKGVPGLPLREIVSWFWHRLKNTCPPRRALLAMAQTKKHTCPLRRVLTAPFRLKNTFVHPAEYSLGLLPDHEGVEAGRAGACLADESVAGDDDRTALVVVPDDVDRTAQLTADIFGYGVDPQLPVGLHDVGREVAVATFENIPTHLKRWLVILLFVLVVRGYSEAAA